MRNSILTILGIFIILQTNAQSLIKESKKKHSVLKFQPTALATSALVLGKEYFNKDNTKSSLIFLGIRYQNTSNTVSFPANNSVEQMDKWIGGSLSLERRYYVPSFGNKANILDANAWGIYFAPALKLDYTQNKFEKSYYDYKYDSQGKSLGVFFFDNKGTGKYLGITPSANVGLQFVIFENMYIDAFVGGGVRFLKSSGQKAKTNNYGTSSDGMLKEFIFKEGVLPNGGFSVGIRI